MLNEFRFDIQHSQNFSNRGSSRLYKRNVKYDKYRGGRLYINQYESQHLGFMQSLT